MFTIQPENPRSKEEILSCFAVLQKEVELYFLKVSVPYFFTHNLGGWSVAENLSHITFTTNMISLALHIPNWLSRIFFGKSKQEISFLETKRKFEEKMKNPHDAGFYSPAIETPPADPPSKILGLVKEWNHACINLNRSLESVSEGELSSYRLPHPVMGKVSYREICFLQILHILHHIDRVDSKLKNSPRLIELG